LPWWIANSLTLYAIGVLADVNNDALEAYVAAELKADTSNDAHEAYVAAERKAYTGNDGIMLVAFYRAAI
jgi:hypothetical protein